MKQIKFLLVAVLTLAMGFSSCSSDENNEVLKSSKKTITQFKVGDVVANINETDKTISLSLPYGTDVTNLKPELAISEKATVNPKAGEEVNLTDAKVYTVTAEDGTVAKYTVTATVAENSAAKITAFDLGEGESKIVGVIDEEKKTVTLTVPHGTIVTSLTPTVVIEGSSVDPKSGDKVNFFEPKAYTVTAADGTKVEYKVTVVVAEFKTAITSVDKEKVEETKNIVLTGTFANSGNVVELTRTDVAIKLEIVNENATTITAKVPKISPLGVYGLRVTSNETVADYKNKITIERFEIVATGISEEAPYSVGQTITLTGKNLETVEEVMIAFPVAGGAWQGDDIKFKPTEVTESTVKLVIPERADGKKIKIYIFSKLSDTLIPTDPEIEVTDSNAPTITSIVEGKVMERTWFTIKGKNLKSDRTVVQFKKTATDKNILAVAYGNENADGTELRVLLPDEIKSGAQVLNVVLDYGYPSQKLTNYLSIEVVSNTNPKPEITSFSNLKPTDEDLITITGKNFTDMDDTRLLVYKLEGSKWVRFDNFELKPRAVTATTVDFKLTNWQFVGEKLKVTVVANGNESAMPTDNYIIEVQE